jgi:hypothetical protein
MFLVVGSSFDQCDWLSLSLSLSLSVSLSLSLSLSRVIFLKKFIKKTLQTIPDEDECCSKERKGKKLIES